MKQHSGDEFSRDNILPMLRGAREHPSISPSTVHELCVLLGRDLCEKCFTGVERPKEDDIRVALRKERLEGDIQVEHVVAGWFLFHLQGSAAYDVVEVMQMTSEPDMVTINATLEHQTSEIQELVADAKHDPELDTDLAQFEDYLNELRRTTPADVLDVWRTCQRFGIPPLLLDTHFVKEDHDVEIGVRAPG